MRLARQQRCFAKAVSLAGNSDKSTSSIGLKPLSTNLTMQNQPIEFSGRSRLDYHRACRNSHAIDSIQARELVKVCTCERARGAQFRSNRRQRDRFNHQ